MQLKQNQKMYEKRSVLPNLSQSSLIHGRGLGSGPPHAQMPGLRSQLPLLSHGIWTSQVVPFYEGCVCVCVWWGVGGGSGYQSKLSCPWASPATTRADPSHLDPADYQKPSTKAAVVQGEGDKGLSQHTCLTPTLTNLSPTNLCSPNLINSASAETTNTLPGHTLCARLLSA